jgi:adenosylcobinamide-GDP ribazoletransferase
LSAWAPVRGARAAFIFLTRLPVGGFPYSDDDWRWAGAYFPLVGIVVGAMVACVDRLLLPLGAFAAALGAVAVSLLVTGAFHEDGFADTTDALGGGFDREKVLLILKDSRIGAYGACALIVSIVGRTALLARLGPQAAWAVPLVAAVARVGPVWQIAALPYVASPASKSRGVARAGVSQASVATAWAVAAGLVAMMAGRFGALRVVAMFAAMAVVTLVSAWRYVRRVGGVTGDFLGATEQLCELVGYAALAWGVAF